MSKTIKVFDANEATAHTAYRINEVIAIYPITPSSGMGEMSDAWSAEGRKNIYGTVPLVAEMQAEGGAAGAIHGAVQTGALTTTFTASQGLLLMIPNMYKIAAELSPMVIHVSSRALSYQAISIYGDHSDVMATRATGFGLIASSSVQEAHDMALIATAASLRSRIPFVHFFDGFRTSHEVNKVEYLEDETLKAMIDEEDVIAHRERGLKPENPFIRGTLQNYDVYFQGRETVNPYYNNCPAIVEEAMESFAKLTGRKYALFKYTGAPDAERVVILMGSGAETAAETVAYLAARGEKVGAIQVTLFRPFSTEHLLKALPETVKRIAVLDRTKESGSMGEPLYQDIVTSLNQAHSAGDIAAMPRIIGGRYGLSGKEFTPAMVKGVLDELKSDKPKNSFTIGIDDDVTFTSLSYDPRFTLEDKGVSRCIFFGLGADGTVGANKNSIKIIGEGTDNYAQGYFEYDSKKSGSITVSHLRFGPNPIRAPYLIEPNTASFVACHMFSFLEKYDVLKYAADGAVFLLNSYYGPEEVWENLPCEVQQTIIDKKLQFYVIDGYKVAEETGMGQRINTIMQTCFFGISGVLPKDEAIARIKASIDKTYGKRGQTIVEKNFQAVDRALENLNQVTVPDKAESCVQRLPAMSSKAPEYVRDVLGMIAVRRGDELPVSKMSVDGTYPSGTSQYEKRNIALTIPEWDSELCIQCGKCVMVCPHASIRQKVYASSELENAPESFRSATARFKGIEDGRFTVQIAPEDCTGCGICVEACPAKDKTNPKRRALTMISQPEVREQEAANWDFFLSIPDIDRSMLDLKKVRDSQFLRPLFEFSGACAGCGETPYVKLLSQLYGDRAIIANATGCSSVYGGSLPTAPWAVNAEGRGPAWSNSLFEDNAEFGFGFYLTVEKQTGQANELVAALKDTIGAGLADAILNADQSDDAGIQAQRERVEQLKAICAKESSSQFAQLNSLADFLVKKSVWIVGGDGWAYDIGYGGLDHVLASGRNVNVLVLDTEVYSNTGGQASKATPTAAVAKFAANGKPISKKDLGMIVMSYGYVYVARVALGANDAHTLKVFREAEAYPGPSLIIAYSHCIAHGIDMKTGLNQQKLAVQAGVWPLYRYNPQLAAAGKNPLQLDSKSPSIPVSEYAYNEARFRMLLNRDEERAQRLMESSQKRVDEQWKQLQYLAERD
ncbi:MAG: pyruvate:ferredoxin (flavodoxin) oxidoreductase [Anaerolineaceae bacterium]|jgi:pyruvate-ferredoxin/flavodoxin oxidoreductase|nr:pyruvate:ferredoxin (flavodoxin) oxidoreductase [Anaerolineaceae bacterium]